MPPDTVSTVSARAYSVQDNRRQTHPQRLLNKTSVDLRQTVGLEAGMVKPQPKQERLEGLLRLVIDHYMPSKPSEPGKSILLSKCQA